MGILDYAILIFVVMESLNVAILYFAPNSRLGNGVAVFNPWFQARKDKKMDLFARYMANWVAGTKLIFIVLLVVILLTGSEVTKVFAVVAMILSIATYFWRLHPIVKELDAMGELTPKGYSVALFWMISGFLAMFSIGLALHFIL